MIVDVFMVNDEFDMVECRLRELTGLVDMHIAIEGNRTMSGDPKPYNFKPFHDRHLEVIQVDLGDLTGIETPRGSWITAETADHWRRDRKQRNAANKIIWDLGDDDVVLTGDVDEIPSREAVEGFSGEPVTLGMNFLVYSSRWYLPNGWRGTNLSRAGDLRGVDADTVRQSRNWREAVNGGWHLSWFGGADARRRKARQFAHGEMARYADRIADDYPRQGLAPDGIHALQPFHGPLPIWIESKLAPREWYE
jgi:hypothetical protein